MEDRGLIDAEARRPSGDCVAVVYFESGLTAQVLPLEDAVRAAQEELEVRSSWSYRTKSLDLWPFSPATADDLLDAVLAKVDAGVLEHEDLVWDEDGPRVAAVAEEELERFREALRRYLGSRFSLGEQAWFPAPGPVLRVYTDRYEFVNEP